MTLPPIDLTEFSWEALATLVTGLAAVIAAMLVGLRQAGIADRQSRILARQVGLDELALRAELFEQRFAVYEGVRKFLAAIMAYADKPEPEIERGYLVAMDQARFLFRPEVHEQLREVWKRACGFFAVKSVMKAQYEKTGDYGHANIEKEHEHLLWLAGKLENLSELFGEELRLSLP